MAGKSYFLEEKIMNFEEYFIKEKSFVATADAVILKSINDEDKNFLFAYRIINGPNGKATSKPYIILFKNENDAERIRIVKELASQYPEDFPEPDDVHYVQFLWQGEYFDKRIRWMTI